MYIQIKNNPNAPVLLSRKLVNALDLQGPAPWFCILSKIKGSNEFAIIKQERKDTFTHQCTMITPTPNKNKRTPAYFLWTIPSMEYFLAVTGITMITGITLKVKQVKTGNITYYRICNK